MIVYNRGKNVALLGAVLQAVFTVVMMVIWVQTGSEAANAASWFTLCGTVLWLMAALLLYARQLARQEETELKELGKSGVEGSEIFARKEALEARPAARHVLFMDKWIAPSFTVFFLICQAVVAFTMIMYLSGGAIRIFGSTWRPFYPGQGPEPLNNCLAGTVFVVLLAFVGFLLARYAVGISERPEWRLLGAAGNYLTLNVISMALVALSLLAAYFAPIGAGGRTLLSVDLVAAYLIAIVQAILAVELLLNFILDLFRPRVPGQVERYSFDSRLFNLVAQPGRVGHSLAEAINYQFGFEVSKSWFYQLVVKAFAPLVLVGLLVLMGLSSLVIVESGQRYVVLHWGQKASVLGPGIHLKWPWPIDTAHRYAADTVHEILLGVGGERTKAQREASMVRKGNIVRELYLWKEEHGATEEKDFLVASPPRDERSAPSVNVIKLVVQVNYRVKTKELDGKEGEHALDDYMKYYAEPARPGSDEAKTNPDATTLDAGPRKLIECIASREMVNYCARATLEKPLGGTDEDRPEAIMTTGRERAAEQLHRLIQTAVDAQKLGVKITLVRLMAVHPPKDLAGDYEQVLEAERRREATLYEAQADANKTLADVAGDPTLALQLALAVRKVNELKSLKDSVTAPAAFGNLLAEYLRHVTDDMKTLNDQIDRERLLGRIQTEIDPAHLPAFADLTKVDLRLTSPQQLLVSFLRYHATLTEIQALAAKGGPELAAAVEKARLLAADGPGTDAKARTDALYGSGANNLLDAAYGQAAAEVAKAYADRWGLEFKERGDAETFNRLVGAYQACPPVFATDRYLDAWDDVLPFTTKYIVAVDPGKVEIRQSIGGQTGPLGGINFGGPKAIESK
ncbi:MAG: SPFH domain-containing protein [Phycisphaerae bacterium]